MQAEDPILVYQGKERKIYIKKNELVRFCEWLCNNKLAVNEAKSKFMIIKNDVSLEQVKNNNYVGLNIDEQLKWNIQDFGR